MVSTTEISRTTYTLGGQTIATRVSGDPTATNNGLFYIFSDHLGSTSALAYGSGGQIGQKVPGSSAGYYPFGSPRTTPTQTITDRNFTGQKENMELGLIYYNARYYVPTIGRFASADTIVPDPANPQSYNRYAYTLNNPVRFVDPSGHSCSNPSNAWPEAETCKGAEQQIMNATLRLIQTTRRTTPSRWSRGYSIELEIGISHATIINAQKAITHNHFEGKDNSQWQIASANGTAPIPPSPGLHITWQGFQDATQTLLMDIGSGLLAYINGGQANPITPIYQNDWSNLIGQEVALISYDGQNTSVVWDTVTGIYQDETGSYFALLSTHVGQEGQSGGGVFTVVGSQVSHIGNIMGYSILTEEARRYLPRRTAVALNSLDVVNNP